MEFQVAFELKLLALAAAIGLVQIIWAAVAASPQRGLKWNLGPRDEPIVITGVAGRLQRAFANFQETFPLFAALVVCAYLTGKSGTDLSVWGSVLYVAGRAAYIPLYALAVSGLRTVAWFVALAGMVMVLIAIFQ